MKYIDKSINEVAGKKEVDVLLEDSWCDDDSCYRGCDYEGLRKPKYRDRLLSLMMREQENLCCYCMKDLDTERKTLEHIIPHHLQLAEFDAYLVTPELTNNVIHLEKFDRNNKVIPPNKYPHDIAYHNLIVSCDSKIHCNNYRSDDKITPLIYDVNIERKIEYDRAGSVSCHQYEDDLNALGLSKPNSPLKFIRLIWYKLAKKYHHIDEITPEVIEAVVLDLILIFEPLKILEDFTGKPSYQDLVMKYKWFFQYYKGVE